MSPIINVSNTLTHVYYTNTVKLISNNVRFLIPIIFYNALNSPISQVLL